MTVVESAARAISQGLASSLEQDLAPGEGVPGHDADWQRYVPLARAVIQALREPSEEMMEAGAEIVRNVHVEESEEAFASDAANTWRFMVDAALTAG